MTLTSFLIDCSIKDIRVYLEDEKLKVEAVGGSLADDEREYLKTNKNGIIELYKKYSIQSNYSLAYLSKQQKRLWIVDQIEPGSTQYNISATLKFEGELNQKALWQALSAIVDRHQVLRTTYRIDELNEAIQVIQSAVVPPLPVVDVSHLADAEQDREALRLAREEASRPFNLSTDIMLRALLVKFSLQSHELVVTMHHIASDGWSSGVLTKELSVLYGAFSRGLENPLPPLAIQYADYSHWQHEWLQGEVLKKQLEYWTGRLQNLPTVHNLPLDRPRPSIPSYRGGIVLRRLSARIRQGLNALAQSREVTLFMILNAAFAALLSRYSGETDIVIGSPIANREKAELAPLVGFFVNTLVLRSDLSGDPGFIDLLTQSKERLFGAYEHQQLPFEILVDELQPARSLSHNPLFQVMLILQNNEQGELALPGLKLSKMTQPVVIAKFDLTLEIMEKGVEGLELKWEYAADLFDASTIERMAEHFEVLLQSIIANPQAKISGLPLSTAAEKNRLLVEWNNTATDYPRTRCMHELFEEQVGKTPTAVALVFENQRLTYGQLNEQANRLAHYLVTAKRVGPDMRLGICMERSLEMVIAILGVLKAGGAYVPLDPEYPQARVAYMLEDAGLETVITTTGMLGSVPITKQQAVCLDEAAVRQELTAMPVTNPDPRELSLASHNLAYVIYTSGSTGKPKGVMIEHASLVNFLLSMSHEPGMSAADTLLAVTSTSFDIHGLELFLPLITGARTVIASRSDTTDANRLMRLLEDHSVSAMQATPATWKMLLEAQWSAGRPIKLLCGGEAWGSMLQQGLLANGNVSLWNMYGPTETTIWSSVRQIKREDKGINIGPPIANTQFYVLEKNFEPCPVGVPGELFIGGEGLARGYLNRGELTDERFLRNPFLAGADGKMYRTGDLVRWLADGNLQFMGRIDHQVKIRGFRIELGEIEAVLVAHELIKDAAVVDRDGIDGDKQLVAYVVPKIAGIALQDDGLRAHLKESLPEYMVPSLFMFLESLPLTPNGKVDRKALPAPDLSASGDQYVAPQTNTERRLCEIWQNLLGADRVGTNDNFFRLGGHSLLAMKLIAEIRSQWSIEIMIKAIFEFPEIGSLSKVVDQAVLTQAGGANEAGRIKKRRDLSEIMEQEGYEL
jgi:amino acid adenylation domain-containing protein